ERERRDLAGGVERAGLSRCDAGDRNRSGAIIATAHATSKDARPRAASKRRSAHRSARGLLPSRWRGVGELLRDGADPFERAADRRRREARGLATTRHLPPDSGARALVDARLGRRGGGW